MIKVGDRIEIHPGHDLWMRGARFGEVRAVSKVTVRVKLDRYPKVLTLHTKCVKLLTEESWQD